MLGYNRTLETFKIKSELTGLPVGSINLIKIT